ncbi:MAG TPA: CsgG/HfaB family protein [Gemmatimonadaceae bacterium]|nr:CsgG/HfaB family protein [Gemmatimonadaceae bacterium]
MRARRGVPRAVGAAAAAVLALSGAVRLPAQSELLSVEPVRRIALGGGAVVAVAFSSRGDSALVLTQSGRVFSVHAASGGLGSEIRVTGRPVALARSRDDTRVAIGAGSEVTLVDADGARRTVRVADDVTSLALSPTGALAAVGTKGGTVVVVSAATGEVAGRLRDGHGRAVVHVAFTGGGETLLSVGEDRGIVYWDVKQLARLRQVTESEPKILSAAGTPAGDLLFVGTEAALRMSAAGMDPMRDIKYVNGVRVYDVANAAPQKNLDLLGRAPIALAVAPDCKYVGAAVRSVRGSALAVFDLERGASVLDLPLEGRVAAVGFSPDGRTLVLGNDAGEIALYRVTGVQPRPRCVADLRGTKFAVTGPRTPLVKPSRRMRFAVLDLDDNGVGPAVSRAIADQLTNRLALNPGIRLVERRRIAAILQEQNFQQSGRTDAQSAIQLARILNVQKVLMGAVAKLGTTMTITVQMVDVETAAIDGSREVQCRACELEDLTQAMSELAQTVVAEPEAAVLGYPEPPEIRLDYPREGVEVSGQSVIVRGSILYSKPLEGVELLVNGRPFDASRLLDRAGGKATRLADGTLSVPFVQEVPLEQANTLIAVRAVGADGNDEQRYVSVRRAASPAPGAPGAAVAAPAASQAPGISLDELSSALKNRVPAARIGNLVSRFGVSFDVGATESRLREAGADDALLRALRAARRTAAPPPA